MKKYIHRGLTARKHQLREGQHRKTSPPSSTATVDPLKKTGSNGGSFGAWCFFFSSCKDVLLLLGIGIKRRLSYLHFTLWNVYTRKITRKLYHLLRNLIFYPVQESHLLRKPLLLFTYICIYIYISETLVSNCCCSGPWDSKRSTNQEVAHLSCSWLFQHTCEQQSQHVIILVE